MVRLNESNGICPNCGMILVENDSSSSASKAEQRILQVSLVITVLLMFILVYIYYVNFA